MASVDWRRYSAEFISEFIEIYRSHPCLWQMKSPDYQVKHLKAEAYDHLVYKLQEKEPDATKADVTRKINSLRTSFRKELRKVKESQRSGFDEVYKPHLWYYNLLDFLCDQDNENQSLEDCANGEDSEVAPEIRPSAARCKTEKSFPPKKKTKLGGGHTAIDFVESKLEIRDCDAAFGHYIVEELRCMNKQQKAVCKRLINEIVYAAQTDTLTDLSKVVVSPEEM